MEGQHDALLQHVGYGTLLPLLILAAQFEVLAADKLKHRMCSGYMSRTNYRGQPYRRPVQHSIVKKASFCLLLCIILALGCHGAAKADDATFGCDAPNGTCYFRINAEGGGSTNFQIGAGKRELITTISPNKDTYCACVDTPAPANWCSAPGYHCMGYVAISPGYNNEIGTTPAIGNGMTESQE